MMQLILQFVIACLLLAAAAGSATKPSAPTIVATNRKSATFKEGQQVINYIIEKSTIKIVSNAAIGLRKEIETKIQNVTKKNASVII